MPADAFDPAGDRPARRRDADGPWQTAHSWESLIEKQIRAAVDDGRFDDLPHQGERLPDDDNPNAGEWGPAYRILKNAGYAPPWIEADREVRELLGRRDAILARAAQGPAPSSIARDRGRTSLEHLVAEANASIARLNAEAPVDRQRRRPLLLAVELARYEAACER